MTHHKFRRNPQGVPRSKVPRSCGRQSNFYNTSTTLRRRHSRQISVRVVCKIPDVSAPGQQCWTVDCWKEKHPVGKVNLPVIQNVFLFIVDTTRLRTTRQEQTLSQSQMMVKMKNPFHSTLSNNNSMLQAHSILTLGTLHLIKLMFTCITPLALFL
jgi:hypothetical protein